MKSTISKKNIGIRLILLIAGVAALVGLDQWTKQLVRERLIDKPYVLIDGVFEFHYLENRGAVWGIMQGQVPLLIIITSIIMLVLIYILFRIPSQKRYYPMIVLDILIIAGAIGNMIDRVVNHYVTDFLYFKLIDFPIFNVADMYVTCSAFIILILAFTLYRNDEWDFLFPKKAGKADTRENAEAGFDDTRFDEAQDRNTHLHEFETPDNDFDEANEEE